jgi:hypothetical protein
MVPGFRKVSVPFSELSLGEAHNYVAVFARATETIGSERAEELMLYCQQNSVPWLVIEAYPAFDKVAIIQDNGDTRLLPREETPLQAQRLSLTLGSNSQRQVSRFLPFHVAVSAETPSAVLSVSLPNSSGFSQDTYYFLFRSVDGVKLGEGFITVDACPQTRRTDRIELKPSGFASEIKTQSWMIPPNSDDESRFGDGPLVLHIIYDRTMLDAESWMVAFDVLTGVMVEEDDVYRVNKADSVSNLKLRENLADAVIAMSPRLHSKVSFHLWWFADKPRDGVAPSEYLNVLREASGPGSRCVIDNLRERLCHPSFEYATGLDLFDAVDEALDQVREYISRNRSNIEQHAVLILGDSPPPPSAKHDVLWQQVVEKTYSTDARLSTLFMQSLSSLKEKDIPVGWLFVKPMHLPMDTPYRTHLRHFQYVQTQKEWILKALEQMDGLLIEGCAETEEIHSALERLFHNMAYVGHPIKGFQILRIGQGSDYESGSTPTNFI